MRIKSLKTWTEGYKLTVPYTIAFATIDAVEIIFVRIEADNGLFGIGSASPSEDVTGETYDDCRRALADNLEDLIIGKDVRHLVSHSREIAKKFPKAPAAQAAIDIALYDLLGKGYQIPVVDLLGRCHHSMPTSVTVGIMPAAEAVESAVEYIAKGFRILKIKTGKVLEEDIEVLQKVREQVGPDIKIRTDANQGYSLEQTIKFMDAIRSLDIELVEQPLKGNKVADMQHLPEKMRKYCMADESLHSPQDALRLAALPQAFGSYNIKLMKAGGISPAIQIAQIALLAGIDLMWGCMDESIVSITAALHAAFASPATKYIDLDGSFDLEGDLVEGGFVLKDGVMSVTEKPGLGVEMLDG